MTERCKTYNNKKEIKEEPWKILFLRGGVSVCSKTGNTGGNTPKDSPCRHVGAVSEKPAALEDDRCSGKIEENNAPANERGIDRSERGEGIITGSKEYIANARYMMKCMAAAPVTVFITHPEGRSLRKIGAPLKKSMN